MFFSKQNNFIFGLLSELWQQLKVSIKSLQKSITEDADRYKTDERLKALHDITEGSVSCQDDTITQLALQIQYTFENTIQQLKTDLTPCLLRMDRIENSNEQIRAPFFTLLFGLAIFSINMICKWCSNENIELVLPSVWIFTLLSIIYWSSIWIAFCFRSMKEQREEKTKRPSSFWSKIDERCNWLLGSTIKIILCGGVALIILRASNNYIVNIPVLWQFTLVVCVLLLSICIIGICRLIWCSVKGKYSPMHVLGHIAAFIVYSTILGFIYNDCGYNACDILFFNYNALNGCVIFFALVNSIIFPFILPHFKYRKPYNETMSELRNNREKLNNAINLFNDDFNMWSRRKVISDLEKEKAQKQKEKASKD
ncbi:MAG: hypothetical protein K2M55_02740 [Muribaculaceae bacterium]|nr:hypothetical protein [Muribaculaceae bacterium]